MVATAPGTAVTLPYIFCGTITLDRVDNLTVPCSLIILQTLIVPSS